MIDYTYYTPKDLAETFRLLEQHGRKAEIIAGGTDVMVVIRQSNRSPEILISLRGVDELRYIQKNHDYHIGALTTHRMIEKSALMKNELTALNQGASQVGSVQVRNVATIGGNVCNAAPSADTASPLMILDALLVLKNSKGERQVPIEEFFVGPSETVKTWDEILTEIIIPEKMGAYGTAYYKHARRKAMNLPIVGVSVGLSLEQDETIRNARIALTVVAPTPIRIREAEDFLRGKSLTDEILKEAGLIASSPECCSPRDSLRCEGWYREDMVRVLIPRVAKEAAMNARKKPRQT
ncbi:MAG: xanthine dehydrogenase family protein subunit M [Deltaproteobacteria bacterium]|nr:xanthine dehydrogenase family protein subunit M [Deltaproteobacteria bacterium]